MTILQVVFIAVVLITLFAAVMVVTVRRMMHAALWLILSLLGVAVSFALLDASFFVVVQVVVYIGAISILIIFAIMLTVHVMQDTGKQLTRNWIAAVVAGSGVFAALVAVLNSWSRFWSIPSELPVGAGDVVLLGKALVAPDQYMLVFEVASVLLLAALVGALYVAVERKK
jgi:NADH-quinone oxidoreductase subunit J